MSWQLQIMHVKRWPQLKAQNAHLKIPSLNHQLIICDFKIQNSRFGLYFKLDNLNTELSRQLIAQNGQ